MYSKKFNKIEMVNDKKQPFIKLYEGLLSDNNLNPTELLLLSIVYDKTKLSVNHKHEFFDKKSLSYFIITSRDWLASRIHVSISTITRTLNQLRKKGYLITKRIFNGGLKIFAPHFKYVPSQPYSKSKFKLTQINNKKDVKASKPVAKKQPKHNQVSDNAHKPIFKISKIKSNNQPINKQQKADMEKKCHAEISKVDNYYLTTFVSKALDKVTEKVAQNPKAYHLGELQKPASKAYQIVEKIVREKIHQSTQKITEKWNAEIKSHFDDDALSKIDSNAQNVKMSNPKKSICLFSHREPNQSHTVTIKTTSDKRSKPRKSRSLNRMPFSCKNSAFSHKSTKPNEKAMLTPAIADNYQMLLHKTTKTDTDKRKLRDGLLRLQELEDCQINKISVPSNAVESLAYFSKGCPKVFKRYVGVMYEAKYIAQKELKKQNKSNLKTKTKIKAFYKAFRFETNHYYCGAKHSLARAIQDTLSTCCNKLGGRSSWRQYSLCGLINYFTKAGKNYLNNHGIKTVK